MSGTFVSYGWMFEGKTKEHLVATIATMRIDLRLRELRRSKNLSQGDIEKKTGLLRCYTSRVENGHTIPTVETLVKYAAVLEVPVYRFFYEGDTPADVPQLRRYITAEWGATAKESNELHKFAKLFSQMKSRHRNLLVGLAQRMATQQKTGRKVKPGTGS